MGTGLTTRSATLHQCVDTDDADKSSLKRVGDNKLEIWRARAEWEWDLVKRAWGVPGVIFPTNRAKEAVMAMADPKNLRPSPAFLHQIKEF